MKANRIGVSIPVCTILAMLALQQVQGNEEFLCSRGIFKSFCLPDNYSKFVLPYTEQANIIGIAIDIDEVRGIDDDTGSITYSTYFNIEWNEPRLRDPPKPYIDYQPHMDTDPLEPRMFPVNTDLINHLWVPNIFIYNLETYERMHTIIPLEGLWIDTDKNVLYSQATKITFICSMRFEKFPFDTQICKFSVGSYSYDSSKLLYATRTYGYSSKDENSIKVNYDIKIGPLKPQDANLDYGPLGNFSLAGFEMVLTRHSTSYIISYFLPSGLVVIISWVSFLIPMEAIHCRMVFLGTLFLVLVNNFSNVTLRKPKTAGLTAIETWMITCILFVFTAFAEYAAFLLKKKLHVSSYDKECFDKEWEKMLLRMDNFSLKAVAILFLLFNVFFWFLVLT